MKKNTIIVNLFAGPGAGKSTGAAYVFSKLKILGIDTEYVTEFAKDKVWENNVEAFNCQFYISGKQIFRISRCEGKVDVIVTDSPIALGAFYAKSDCLKNAIIEEAEKHHNLNFFIERVKDYNPNGRNQTEEEAIRIDQEIKNSIGWPYVDYYPVDGNEEGYEEIVEKVLNYLKNGE